jgi:hypothetical protein
MYNRRDFDPGDFEDHYQRRYANTGRHYEYFEPGYRYGFDIAYDERYRSYSWHQVLAEVRKDWGRRYPGLSFQEMSDAIYSGWQLARGEKPDQPGGGAPGVMDSDPL